MIGWFEVIPIVMIAMLVVFVPGIAVGFALRLRGLLLWGFAPAAGVAALAVSAVVVGLTPMHWSVWTAGAAVVALVAIAALLGLLVRPAVLPGSEAREGGQHPQRPTAAVIAAAIAAGALLGALRMASVIGSPSNVSQTNDATFHLSALRFIAESGSASSLDILGTVGASGFYPAAWHAVGSLVAQLTGVDVVVAANTVALVIAGPIWTVSITSFVRYAVGPRRSTTIAAALLSPMLYAFPFYMLDFGVLYPYALSLAVLPGVLALLPALLPTGDPSMVLPADARRGWIAGLATLVGLAGIVLAQPAVLLSWLIGAVLFILVALTRGGRAIPPQARRRRATLGFALLAASALVWIAITRVSSSALWPPRKPAALAALDLMFNNSTGQGPAIVISLFAAVGAIHCLRTPELRWLSVHAGVLGLLTLVAVSVQNEWIRGLLAAWYADPHRFVAMMPLVVIPLGAIGLARLSTWARSQGRSLSRVVFAVGILAAVAETASWAGAGGAAEKRFYGSVASYLSSDEQRLLELLPRYVGADERVLGNPAAGAAFGYALSGVDVVPRTWSMPEGAEYRLLSGELVDLADEPLVCDAVDQVGADYVLDFGMSEKGAGREAMPGMTGFDDAEGFRKVAEVGDASLWRIVGCD